MKIKNLILFLITLVLISSCKKGLTEFNLTYQTSFTVPSSTGITLPISLPTPDVTTNTSQEFKDQGTEAKLVKEVKLTSLKLTITSPSGKTFSFLNSIHIYISADNQPEVEIGYLDNISNSVGSTITLTLRDVLLDSYVKADKFKIRSKVVTDEMITQDVSIRADMIFHVKANLL